MKFQNQLEEYQTSINKRTAEQLAYILVQACLDSPSQGEEIFNEAFSLGTAGKRLLILAMLPKAIDEKKAQEQAYFHSDRLVERLKTTVEQMDNEPAISQLTTFVNLEPSLALKEEAQRLLAEKRAASPMKYRTMATGVRKEEEQRQQMLKEDKEDQQDQENKQEADQQKTDMTADLTPQPAVSANFCLNAMAQQPTSAYLMTALILAGVGLAIFCIVSAVTGGLGAPVLVGLALVATALIGKVLDKHHLVQKGVLR